METNKERKDKAKSTTFEGAGMLLLYWAMEAISGGEHVFGFILLIVGLGVLYISWTYGVKVPKEYADEIRDTVDRLADTVSSRMDEEGGNR